MPTTISAYHTNLWAGRTVGLLGGSFNPAHAGHRHISLYALKNLGLDAVWWMVSPQNPLKSHRDMAPLKERVASAVQASHHPDILVTDIEQQLHTRYTADTLVALQQRYSRTQFIWLMGSDNLQQIHRWQEWQKIFGLMPVAVFDRPPRSIKSCPALERFRSCLKPQEKAALIKFEKPPAWTILHIPLNELSATKIREKRKLQL
ncbi:MAG: nicotinate-nucleotide adenylyltransferase [Proteobacteria bacterium]|nr:nicotinate-nucleotide adenylyltransferase [Pseudomonadota bacterium]